MGQETKHLHEAEKYGAHYISGMEQDCLEQALWVHCSSLNFWPALSLQSQIQQQGPHLSFRSQGIWVEHTTYSIYWGSAPYLSLRASLDDVSHENAVGD